MFLTFFEGTFFFLKKKEIIYPDFKHNFWGMICI